MGYGYRGSQEQQPQSRIQEVPAQSSGYSPSGVSSQNSSHPSTPGRSSSNGLNVQTPSDQPQSLPHGQFSHTEAASIIGLLKNKSVDELRKLLSDKDTYNQFLLSLEVVKIQNNVNTEISIEIGENLKKEPRILELRNQCKIIRTTELAAAQEKLNALERRKEESLRAHSPSMLLQKLQEAMGKAEEETENLQRQLLEKEIEPAAFVQNCKRLRTTYQRRALIHLAANASVSG
ncbi:Modifier of rudimentary [Macleaya cordata]|uniref:Modifier of rudimentary n=1 Tax=Macleaya cordata TaxID=56857 RepID=A0A200R5E1_MACCD|nr:Modifier of rudimentary [Macleaya cordata]